MLSKLLKHEFRATGRIMGVFYIVLFASALFTALTNWVLGGREILFLSLLNGLVVFVFVLSLIAAPIVAVVLTINRFYKNLMTDEGYLMFTLPANEHQLIASKLIVSLVWFIASIVADVLSAIIAFFDLTDYGELWTDIVRMLSHIHITVNDVTGYTVEMIFIFLLGCIATCLVVYGAISVGYSFANKKGLLSVAFFFAFNIGLQILGTGAVVLTGEAIPLDTMTAPATIHATLCLVLAFLVLVCVGFYILTYEMLHRRLNLQ